MINMQFSKCPVCGKAEIYVRWINTDDGVKEVRVCSNACMIKKGNDNG